MSYGSGGFTSNEKVELSLKTALQRVQTDLERKWFNEPNSFDPKTPQENFRFNVPNYNEIKDYLLIDPNVDGQGTSMITNVTVANFIGLNSNGALFTLDNIRSGVGDKCRSEVSLTNASLRNYVDGTNNNQIKGLGPNMFTRYSYYNGIENNGSTTYFAGKNWQSSQDTQEPFNSIINLKGDGTTDVDSERNITIIKQNIDDTDANSTKFYNNLISASVPISIIKPPTDWNSVDVTKSHPFIKVYIQVPTYASKLETNSDNIAFTNPVLKSGLGDTYGYSYFITGWDGSKYAKLTTSAPENLFYNSTAGIITVYGKVDPINGTRMSQKYPPMVSFIRYTGETLGDGIISQGPTLPAPELLNNKDLFINTTDNTIHRLKEDANGKSWVGIGGSGGSGGGSNSSTSELNAINSGLTEIVNNNYVKKDSIEYTLNTSVEFGWSATCSLNKYGNKIVVSKERLGDIDLINPPLNTIVYEFNNNGEWCKVGDFFCHSTSVSMNDEGNIIAIANNLELFDTDGNSFSPKKNGVIKLFERDDTTILGWKQIHQDIKLDNPNERPSINVKLNSSGNIFIIDIGDGNIKIYERTYNNFDIIGQYTGAISPSINDEGNIISLTILNSPGDQNNQNGVVKIFERNNGYTSGVMNGWKPLGGDILLNNTPNLFGSITHFDSTGKVISISNRNFIQENTNDSVYVYQLSNDNNTWNQIGNTIEGLKEENLGYNISLSSDGSILAILSYYILHFTDANSSKYYKNEIKVYEKRTTSTGTIKWELLGTPIKPIKNHNDFKPISYLSMSKDGRILACNNGIYTIKTSKIMGDLVVPNIKVSNKIATKNVIFDDMDLDLIIRNKYELKLEEYAKNEIVDLINSKFNSQLENSNFALLNTVLIANKFAVLASTFNIIIFEKNCLKWELKDFISYDTRIENFTLNAKNDENDNLVGLIQVELITQSRSNPYNQLHFIKYDSALGNKWNKVINENTSNDISINIALSPINIYFNTLENLVVCKNYIPDTTSAIIIGGSTSNDPQSSSNTPVDISGIVYNSQDLNSITPIFSFDISNNFTSTSVDSSNNQYRFTNVQMITDKFIIFKLVEQYLSGSDLINIDIDSVFTFKYDYDNSSWIEQAIELEFDFNIYKKHWLHSSSENTFLTIYYILNNDDVLSTYTFDETLNNWKKITTLQYNLNNNDDINDVVKNIYVNGIYVLVTTQKNYIDVFKLIGSNANNTQYARWDKITDLQNTNILYGIDNKETILNYINNPYISEDGDLVVTKDRRSYDDINTLEESKVSFIITKNNVKFGPWEGKEVENRCIRITDNKFGIKSSIQSEVNHEIDVDGNINFTGNLLKEGKTYVSTLSGSGDPQGSISGVKNQFYIQTLAEPKLWFNNGNSDLSWNQISGSAASSGSPGGFQTDFDQILKQTSDEITVSEQLLGTDNYEDIEGSSIAYTFPPGASKVIYKFSFNLTWNELDNRGDTISEYQLGISRNNGNDYTYILKRFTLRNSVFSENFVTIEHVIKEEDYTDITNIKLVGKSINSEFKQKIHKTYYPYEHNVNPILELVTLGQRTIQAAPLFNRNLDSSIYYDSNVGIGFHSPQSKLVVKSNDIMHTGYFHNTGGGYSTGKSAIYSKMDANSKNNYNIICRNSEDNDFFVVRSDKRVGIGTNNPETYLHIHNNSGNWSVSSKIRLSTDTFTDSEMRHSEISYFRGSQDASTDSDKYAGLGEGLRLSGNGTRTDLCILNKDGNIGIGTTNPSKKLDIHSTHDTATGLYEANGINFSTRNSSNSWSLGYIGGYVRAGIDNNSSGYPGGLIFKTKEPNGIHDNNLIERMVINANGNVGIGTTNPKTKLYIKGDSLIINTENPNENNTLTRVRGGRIFLAGHSGYSQACISGIDYRGGPSGTYKGGLAFYVYKDNNDNNPGLDPLYQGNVNFDAGSGMVEAIRIDNNGKVGIGITNPNSKLQVFGGVSIGNIDAAPDGNLKVAGSITGGNITSTGTISGATITTTGSITSDGGTISGATITSTGNISLNGADIDSFSGSGLYLQSGSTNNKNVKIPTGKLVVGSTNNASYPVEVHGSTVRGDANTPYLNFGSVGIHVQEDKTWDQYNQLIYAAATGNSGRNIFIKSYGSRDISIWSEKYVACAGIQQVSDERIKINIRDISDNISLQKLRDISCCLYEYKDPLSRDFYTQIGFIAQQVNEHFPLAISFVKDIIPNEMRIIENPQWSKIIDGSNNKFKLTIPDLEDVSGNTKYKFYMSNDVSGNDECEKISFTLEDDPKSFIFDQSWNYLYLYGKEVDDFHRINKDKLFALNFSATQEIDKIQQQQLLDISGNTLNIAKNETDIELLKLENSELKTENADLKTELVTLKTQMTDVLSRLSQLESN